ncbi:hypothetical protein P3631_16885, partial [Vibrio parahaemolyticus]|nr:hypothetical protein [Vibrio parahaemolyticus]
MKMIFEMQYRRTEKFIYKREEICSIFRSHDIEQIITKHDYMHISEHSDQSFRDYPITHFGLNRSL